MAFEEGMDEMPKGELLVLSRDDEERKSKGV